MALVSPWAAFALGMVAGVALILALAGLGVVIGANREDRP